MAEGLRARLRREIDRGRDRILDPHALEATLARLGGDGLLEPDQVDELRAALPAELASSRYVVGNLGAHLGIGVVFAFDVVPLPLGTISRVAWVAGARIVETVRGRKERARVHSIGVFLIAAIPLAGYAAYLLPLRRESLPVAWLLANHLAFERAETSWGEWTSRWPGPLPRLAHWLVPPHLEDPARP